jgi:exosortase A-associated hydrolase 1
MSYQETGVVFECEGESLVGVLATPDHGPSAGDGAVVLLVGGPQYRVGSHRLFTVLMRTLASAGYPSLRFDFRGMGDSTGLKRGFEEVSGDVAAAIDAVQRHCPHIRRIVLFGLCDGASAALIYLSVAHDPRIRGLCLVNPWVRSDVGLSRVHVKHYYARRLVQREFWRKLRDAKAVGRALQGWLVTCTRPSVEGLERRVAR